MGIAAAAAAAIGTFFFEECIPRGGSGVGGEQKTGAEPRRFQRSCF